MASPWARLWGASSAPADAPPASERIDELRRDVAELREQLAPQLKADIERVTGEGRPFDPAGWVMGVPDSRKYPAGPAFMPLGASPTFLNSLSCMSAADVGTTALGSAAAYTMGVVNAGRLGVVNGHRFGLWLALPAVAMGVLVGSRNGMFRYLGFTDNGNTPLYPGYVEDATPYYVKHSVSDRHFHQTPDRNVERVDVERRNML